MLITMGFPPMVGGISTYSYQLAKGIGRRIVVLTPSCRGVKAFDKSQRFRIIRMKLISMHILHTRKSFLLFNIFVIILMAFYVLFYAVKLRPKGIYLSHWLYAISALPASKLLEIPYSFAVHGSEVFRPMRHRFYKAVLKECVKNARRIISPGNYQKDRMAKEGVAVSKVYVIGWGVNPQLFRPDIDPSEIVERHNLENKKVILTVGRLVTRKGHDMVVKSLPNVLKSVPNTVYVIVGEGQELKRLKSLVKGLSLEDDVIFAGYVPSKDLPKYYNACDVFVMPSREVNGDIEGFGIVYVEANACGKPVIAGKSGGTGSAVRHGVNGVLINPLDTEEISKQIISLLVNEKLAHKMGKKGRMLVEKTFNSSIVAKKIFNIINE